MAVSLVALGVLAALALERAIAGWRAYRTTGDAVALAFPFAHLARDVCWASAIARLVRAPNAARSRRAALEHAARPAFRGAAAAPRGADRGRRGVSACWC